MKSSEMKLAVRRIRLAGANDPMFAGVWELYSRSFPADERRLLAGHLAILGKREYRCESVEAGGDLVGLLFWWSLSGLRYVEHLATSPARRGQGLGRRILEGFIAESASPVLLEVEKPELAATRAERDLRQRRINFYRRLNFALNRYDYVQPPYFAGGERLKLYVMSHPDPLSREALEEFVSTCHPIVYGATNRLGT